MATLQQAQQAGQIAANITELTALATALSAWMAAGAQVQSLAITVLVGGSPQTASVSAALSAADTATIFNQTGVGVAAVIASNTTAMGAL